MASPKRNDPPPCSEQHRLFRNAACFRATIAGFQHRTERHRAAIGMLAGAPISGWTARQIASTLLAESIEPNPSVIAVPREEF